MFVQDEEIHVLARQFIAIATTQGGGRLRRRVTNRIKDKFHQKFDARLQNTPMPNKKQLDRYADAFCSDLYSACEALAENLVKDTDATAEAYAWANGLVITEILDSIEQYLSSVGEQLREPAEWTRQYLNQFRVRHERIELPDLNSRRRVEYQKLFIEPVVRLDSNDTYATRHSRTAPGGLPFQRFVSGVDRTVLLGKPGAGKSTGSAIASLLAADAGKIPFIVVLRSLPHATFNLCEALASSLQDLYQVVVTAKEVEIVLHSGLAFIVFDGLDEILVN